ncbi:NAD(+) diphosphatase [Rhodovibrionaceae bacterium A322]
MINRPNFFAENGLNRADHHRSDPDWLKAREDHPDSRFVAVWRYRSLIIQSTWDDSLRAAFLPPEVATELNSELPAIFLGLDKDDRAYFALDISSHPLKEEETPELKGHGQFLDLREMGQLLPHQDGGILALARGMIFWHRKHRFCGSCGSLTKVVNAGHQRRCTNEDCKTPQFPRTDPAVIMLVHDGADRCVLGRHPLWPKGNMSTLAGFVEPGESLEEAVIREVYEEVGLRARNATYVSSQPWPFPSSLMLGYFAEADYGPLTLQPDEIETARWFHRDEILNCPFDDDFKLPREISIARRLIQTWVGKEV